MTQPSESSLAAVRAAVPCERIGIVPSWIHCPDDWRCESCRRHKPMASFLDAQLAQARAEERERCRQTAVGAASSATDKYNVDAAIRALTP